MVYMLTNDAPGVLHMRSGMAISDYRLHQTDRDCCKAAAPEQIKGPSVQRPD
jgi:hypothetical protein